MSVIIGITGAIHSGKSTVADFLRNQQPSHAFYESGELIAELANDFNRALSGELAFEITTSDTELANQALIWFVESINENLHQHVTWNQLAITKHLTSTQPELVVKLFQYIYAAKEQPSILDAEITAANKEQYRALLQWLGGYLVARISPTIWYDEIFRRINLHDDDKSLIIVSGLRYPNDAAVVRKHGGIVLEIDRPAITTNDTDVTEKSRSDITPDITLQNKGDLTTLATVVETLWNDIVSGNPAKTYISE